MERSFLNCTFFTVTEIATQLKTSKARIYRLMALGELPSIHFGRTVRVREEDLIQFLSQHSTTSSSSEALPSALEASMQPA